MNPFGAGPRRDRQPDRQLLGRRVLLGRLFALDGVLEVSNPVAEALAELGSFPAPKMMITMSRMISSSGRPSEPNIWFSFEIGF